MWIGKNGEDWGLVEQSGGNAGVYQAHSQSLSSNYAVYRKILVCQVKNDTFVDLSGYPCQVKSAIAAKKNNIK